MTTVVVGGGIGGIVAGLLARLAGDDVTLVERASQLGGLLRTSHEHGGLFFDHGTHIPTTTGVDALDDILFAGRTEWIDVGVLRAGNVFAGAIDDASAFVDTRRLPRDVYADGFEALVSAPDVDTAAPDLAKELIGEFGAVFADHVFRPALEKFLGTSLDTVTPGTHRLFGMTRLIASTAEATRALKAVPSLDRRLAFHSRLEGVNPADVRYPASGGTGAWVDALEAQAVEAGVDIRVGAQLTELRRNGGTVTAVCVDDDWIDVERLVWTVPPALLAPLLGIEGAGGPPRLRITTLHHLVFDQPFTSSVHFAYVFDPSYRSFRVTLYPNILRQAANGRHHCTVEVLGDGPEPDVDVAAELRAMGVVPASATVQHHHTSSVAGFPVPTIATAAAGDTLTDAVAGAATNVQLLGKAAGRDFFMVDVLRSAHRTLAP